MSGTAKAKWDREIEVLIRRFRETGPAEKPFELRSGCTVIDPAKFHEVLKAEIDLGPRGARARMGAVQGDLKDYMRIRGA
jgi:hypothetical protein